MSKVNWRKLTSNDLMDHASISAAFKTYLIEVIGYSESEADFIIAADFANPYNTSFIMQDFERMVNVDGKEYEVRSCYTDFSACGLFHPAKVKRFKFYMLFDLETLPDQTVASYSKSKKWYLLKD